MFLICSDRCRDELSENVWLKLPQRSVLTVRSSPFGVRSASGSAPNPLYSRLVFVPSVPLW
jgi:hypothetical protein